MKIYKKILFGLLLATFLAGPFIFLFAGPVGADHEPVSDPQRTNFYMDECVKKVSGYDDNTNKPSCRFFEEESNVHNYVDLTYGDGRLTPGGQNNFAYVVPYRAADYTPDSPPGSVQLFNQDGSPAFGPTLEFRRFNFFTLASTRSQTEDGDIVYYAYLASGDTDYRLLLGFRENGTTPVVFALVNLKFEAHESTNQGAAWGYSVNRNTVERNEDGSLPNDLCDPADPGCTPASAADNSCEAISSTALEWIMCPIFKIADGIAGVLINLFIDLLSFRIDDSNEGYEKSLKPAWGAIKNIVSALVVIVMLVMIFAQAASIGPIDAYTIRKLLPKIVAAVILIQISWYLFVWVINAVDDIGIGLKDLLEDVFRTNPDGVNINDFFELLANAEIGAGQLTFINFAAVLGVIVAAAVALPLVLLGLLAAIVALLVAVAVLLFRMVLILTLLLSAPVALLAWVLPNTEKYWKMWWDNFLKVLFMFPIIILIIMAGRIFAYVAGPTFDVDTIAFFAVIIGFFGPLFLLPKAYKWGGTLMQFAGQGATRAGVALSGKESAANKYLRNRQKDWQEQRRRASVQRVASNEGFNRKRPWRYPLDRFRSGKWDPLKQTPGYREVGKRSVEEYIHAGEEIHQKDVEAARAKVLREGQAIRARGGNWDKYFQMVGDGVESYRDEKISGDKNIKIGKRSKLEQEAAMKQTAILGSATNWRYLESKYEQMREMGRATIRNERGEEIANPGYNPQRAAEMRKFFDDNVQTIMPKMPHMYRGVFAAADASQGDMGQMHGVEVESILGNLSKIIQDTGRDPGDRATAQRQLVTFLQNYQAAAANENIHLENGGIRAVKAFLDSTGGNDFMVSINEHSEDGRIVRKTPVLQGAEKLKELEEVDASVKEALDGLKSTFADRINSYTGNYTAPPPEGELHVDR